MTPQTLAHREIEILLDSPNRRDHVVSVYADMDVSDGFHRYMERRLKDEARAARDAMAGTGARQQLDENLEVIRELVEAHRHSAARGLAIFSGAVRGLRQAIPLDFPVEDRLVIDEDPFLLPLLEHWYGEPSFLVCLVDSNQAHLFESHHGHSGRLRDLERGDVHQDIQRDRPRFTYKRRFTATGAYSEHLHGPEDAPFLRTVADAVEEQWKGGYFAGMILLGRPEDFTALRRHLPRSIDELVAGEIPHAMASRPEDVTSDVEGLIQHRQSEFERRLLAEMDERRKRDYLVADGAIDVLDALQQGRAIRVLFGHRRGIPGAHCMNCNYRFGTPAEICPYCGGFCRRIDAVQDIMRLSMRHRVPIHLFRGSAKEDPLDRVGGVAAMLRAPANWGSGSEASPVSDGNTQAE